ncbi:MAG TPA: choice-of-anchor tandem repeat GloVer-containing protein [Verrucomicrobiae bacterium]|nr:choice-of-anchor tandem repeat GloVer-containing protein [Verrucomicrobiae bacterium]
MRVSQDDVTSRFVVVGVFWLLWLTAASRPVRADFIHPGIYHSQADLDRMKSMVASNTQPWASGYYVFSTNEFSQSSYGGSGPFGFATAGRNPDVNRTALDQNSVAAYDLALRWYITGNQAYANKAIQILDGWSGLLTNLTGTDVRLLAALDGTKLINSAEILRYTGSGWTNYNRFGTMMLNVFYPICKDFSGDGGWSSSSMEFVMSLGIFLDNEAMFDSAVNAFKYGPAVDCSGAVTNYIQAQGWNYETSRDLDHSQLGIGLLAENAEIAWKQGLDLYSYGIDRVFTGFEYQAKWLLVTNVPFSSWTACDGTAKGSIATYASTFFRPIYEMVWNHYYNRMGITNPIWTATMASTIRPENAMTINQCTDHPGFGTLLFSLPTRTSGLPLTPIGLTATPGNAQVSLSWSASSGATSYNVKRATARGGPCTTIASNVVTTSYTDTTASNGTTYYYVVSAVNGAGETMGSGLDIAMPTNVVPSTPTNLVATALSASQIGLSWTNSSGARSYNVKRSLTNGGSYANVANVQTFASYADNVLAAGTLYYYVVSATNGIGESTNSAQVSTTTLPSLPTPWLDQDVGAVGTVGNAVYSNAVFTVRGAGQGLNLSFGYNCDIFHFTYLNMTGNGTLTARLSSEIQGGTIDQVGLMMRETTNNNSRAAEMTRQSSQVLVGSTPADVATNLFGYRSSTGGGSAGTFGADATKLPQWYRLERTGNTIIGFSSTNGTTWTQVGSTTFSSLNNTILVGLEVCSRLTYSLNVSTFDNVSVPGWSAAPVASFTAAPTSGVAPLAVTFTDKSSGSITNWYWSFGDGGTTNLATGGVVHTYNTAGAFNVTEIVNGAGGSGTDTVANCITTGLTNSISTSSSPSVGGTTGGGGIYTNGSTATVTATPNACYAFVDWTENGSAVSMATNYGFTVTTNRSLVANFSVVSSNTITTISQPSGGGTTSGGGTIPCGSNVTVCATANACYNFVNWTDQNSNVVSTSRCYTIAVTSNETLVAWFAPTSNTISATSSPLAGGSISGTGTVVCGSNVTVCATPNGCYSFVDWTDQHSKVVSTTACYSFTATTNQSLVANFSLIFSAIQTNGGLTNLRSFSGGSDGAVPYAGLVQGSDGNFYGTTVSGGGANGYGTVFRITANGSLTNLWSFSGGSDGAYPYAGLVQGSDSNFYGTTYGSGSGSSAYGTVFRITANGSLTNLWSFSGGSDGAFPYAGLVQGSDSNFYGTTLGSGSGSSAYGTVFRISSSGSLTALWSFTNGVDGATPYAPLVQGSDGNFYGTTSGSGSGSSAYGTVFRISASGSLTSLWSFVGCGDGANPYAGLVQGSDGNLYGTTESGGDGGYGTVFQIATNGSLMTLWLFTNGVDGANSSALLVQGVDGYFYGTTEGSGSGASANGTVFRLTPSAPVASFSVGPSTGFEPLTVLFTDASTGIISNRFWNFGDGSTTNTTATSVSHVYAAGSYTVTLVVSGAGGVSTNAQPNCVGVLTAYQSWQLQYFGCTNCPQAAANADPLGKGMSNTNQFLAGFNPTNTAAYVHVISITSAGSNVTVTYLGANGDNTWSPGIASRTNVLEFTIGAGDGSYSNNFTSTGQTNILSGGNGLGVVTNMVDSGGVTNEPSRYYRVRVLVP